MEQIIDSEITKRLIVLIHNSLFVDPELARSVYRMAERENLPVLYLVLVEDQDLGLAVSRNMATVRALTSANRLLVDVRLTDTGQWLNTLRETTGAGDLIVLQDGFAAGNGSLKSYPAGEFLASQLDSPNITVSSEYQLLQPQTKKWFQEIVSTLGFLLIIAFFTWAQIKLDIAFEGALAKIFVLGSFLVEIGAIWGWSIFPYK